MSISDWSNYEGKSSDVKWSKDDLLEHLVETENVSETSSKGNTFMHVAGVKGWQDVIVKLNEVDPAMKDAQSDIGTTPAMNAALYKKTGIVKYLLDQGANPSIVNDIGHNLLHYAVENGVLQGNQIVLTMQKLTFHFFGLHMSKIFFPAPIFVEICISAGH